MRIGMHSRLGGGIDKSLRLAAENGCEAVQIFASNPNAWKSSALTSERVEIFRTMTEEFDLRPSVIHTPYLLNLASPDEDIYQKSIHALGDAMHRADQLGAAYVVTHIGSHKGTGFEAGRKRILDAVSGVLGSAEGTTVLLLENSSGAGDSIGSCIEDLGCLMRDLTQFGQQIGVCLDTAHLWGAGYDVSNSRSIDSVVDEFARNVGLEKLRLLHLNDTKVELGSKKDRHANIGTGHIGEQGFRHIVNHPDLSSLTGIVETPGKEEGEIHDVMILKGLRN